MIRTILIELAHSIISNAYCINERLNHRSSYGKMAILYVKDVQFVEVNVLFYIF